MTIESANDNVKISSIYRQSIVSISSKYRQFVVKISSIDDILTSYCQNVVSLSSVLTIFRAQMMIFEKVSFFCKFFSDVRGALKIAHVLTTLSTN